MFIRALLAFLILPGLFAGLLPPLLAGADPWRGEPLAAGYAILALGGMVLLWCVRDFYVAGKGTLAPWDPPQRIVIIGLYRYVRNPMYIGVLLIVCGWALTFGSPAVGGYNLLLALGFHLRVLRFEEPWLARQFPDAWPVYRAAVPRWLPRIEPYTNGD